jgi:hypothetical protein
MSTRMVLIPFEDKVVGGVLTMESRLVDNVLAS